MSWVASAVAGEQPIDVALADQFGNVPHAAGMHDRRPADDQRFAPRLPVAMQFLGNLPDGDSLGLFGRDGTVHEFERLPVVRLLVGKDAHAGMADDEQRAQLDFAHRHAARLRAAGSTATAQSISWSATSIHRLPSRISVRWLVVL